VKIQEIKKRQDNVAPDKSLRPPRNRMDGDMPQMGLLTGGCDDLGCFGRKTARGGGDAKISVSTWVATAQRARTGKPAQLYWQFESVRNSQANRPWHTATLRY
jgi:hypothetical protein